MFIGLSSGYDSGAIHAALVKDRTSHFAYTVHSTEDMEILKQRINWAGNWTETNVIATRWTLPRPITIYIIIKSSLW